MFGVMKPSKVKWSLLMKVTITLQRNKSDYWSSQLVRKTFVEYFKSKNHVFVPSSSVIPKKQDGSYFVNSGMNQFKSIFTGGMEASESDLTNLGRVVNHQKCIRVGGKHNDLETVGQDFYHHTFFEMLGNWSFNGNYSKHEACKMAWELLTDVYKIPANHLYITYFHGNEKLNLPADLETLEIWRSLGVPDERILPFGMEHNFWTMGATGPCGPCTEIHYCHPSSHQQQKSQPNTGLSSEINSSFSSSNLSGSEPMDRYREWVNGGREEVKEIWNLVFMQYDMQADQSLHRLPQEHIDTGMGLERLTALLQGTISNYNTDLFIDLFSQISTFANCPPYQGQLHDPVDIAYRVVGDHVRMATMCISDGLIPGRKDSAGKLRQVMYRCLHHLETVLKAPGGFMASLMPLVADSLGDAYPEVGSNVHLLREVTNETELRYLENIKNGKKIMIKALKNCQSNFFTGKQILDLQEGKFGKAVSLDIIMLLAKSSNVTLDILDYEKIINDRNQTQATSNEPKESRAYTHPRLSQKDVEYLKGSSVPTTDDSFKHHRVRSADDAGTLVFPDLPATVTAIKCLASNQFISKATPSKRPYLFITDKSNFHPEGGGQVSDQGVLYKQASDGSAGEHLASVTYVSSMRDYVSHYVSELDAHVSVGQSVVLSINQELRRAIARNHTATHLIHNCLQQVLGSVMQQGSAVKGNYLTFDFTSLKTHVRPNDLTEVVRLIDEAVALDWGVFRSSKPYKEVEACKEVCRLDEVYPSNVTVVSIGVPFEEFQSSSSTSSSSTQPPLQSMELCGGTHVDSTGQLGRVVVTNFEGSIQGNKRITAVTGKRANQAVKNGEKIRGMLNEAKAATSQEDVVHKLEELDRLLASNLLLGKLDREAVLEELKVLNFENSHFKNRLSIISLFKDFSEKVEKASSEHYCIMNMDIKKLRPLVTCLLKLNYPKPIFILASSANPNFLGLCYVPQNYKAFSSSAWIENVCNVYDGKHSAPKGKLSKHDHISLFTLPVKSNKEPNVNHILKTAEFYAQKKMCLVD